MKDLYCVIMAGGKGERFWPCSRENTPKQLQNIVGQETLIEQTVLRLIPLTDFKNILIITNDRYADQIRHLLPQLPAENIIGEPCGRDTAPCVALAMRRHHGCSGRRASAPSRLGCRRISSG